jgi:hypothetical protein
MNERMQSSPAEWGDPLYRLRHLGLVVHRARVTFFYVSYAVDETRRIVYVMKVIAVAGEAFDPPAPPPHT